MDTEIPESTEVRVYSTREQIKMLDERMKPLKHNIQSTHGRLAELRQEQKRIEKEWHDAQVYRRDTEYELDELVRQRAELAKKLADEPDFEDPRFLQALEAFKELPMWATLHPFQQEGIALMLYRYTCPNVAITDGFLNADDTGLGKTAMTAMTIQTIEKLLDSGFKRERIKRT